jgi:hypothetical protein
MITILLGISHRYNPIPVMSYFNIFENFSRLITHMKNNIKIAPIRTCMYSPKMTENSKMEGIDTILSMRKKNPNEYGIARLLNYLMRD